jgi:hypothetical protein
MEDGRWKMEDVSLLLLTSYLLLLNPYLLPLNPEPIYISVVVST